MRPTQLQATLAQFVEMKRPMLIEGAPGLGKTQLCEGTARSLGWNGVDNTPNQPFGYIHFHAPTKQPEDYAMPVVDREHNVVNFVVDAGWPVVGNDKVPERGLFCIDEMPQADNSGQKILANVIQQRELYGRKIKPGWTFVATGNRPKDKAGANKILSHLRARVTTIEFEPQLEDWVSWAYANGVNPMVVAFLRFKPGLLLEENDQLEIKANPRAWTEGVSPILGRVSPDAEFECIKGAVGEGAASEFIGFVKLYRELPDPDLIIKNPLTFDVSSIRTKPSVLYALTGALASRTTIDNFGDILSFYERDDLPAEFMVLYVRDACSVCPAVDSTQAFVKWSIGKGAKVLMSN